MSEKGNMMIIHEIIKAILLGIIEGITEWLPVSSTGHLLLFDNIMPLNQSEAFRNMLVEVIQLGAILSVVIIFFGRLNPFSTKKTSLAKKTTWNMWLKIFIAVIPGGVAVIVLKFLNFDLPDNPFLIAGTLFVYGIAFIVIERARKNKPYRVDSADSLSYKDVLLIGTFQVLSIVPGTSRSGSTILGGMLLGVSRTAAADFSFFLAIPAMLGASGIEVLSFIKDLASGTDNIVFGAEQAIILTVASLVSFAVSFISIKFLMNFVKKHSFEAFGWYRIALAVLVVLFFSLSK